MVSVPNANDILLIVEIGNGMKDDVHFLFAHARARFLIRSIILISVFLHVYYHF